MAEDSKNKPTARIDKTGEFFNVGAPLHAVRPGYVRRTADELLFDTVVAGNYAHVIAPDRTGKTSLIASTSARLQNNGFKVAVLDLAQISERDGGSDAGRWYYSIAYRLSRQLRLKTDLQGWWQDHTILSNRQRLVEFYAQLVLQNIQERIVVFVDEVQSVADLPFTEHLLASIRAAHNSRTTEPEFNRLGFVMIGECDPYTLAGDPQLSPFLVSTEIRLNDFTREDLNVFAVELNLSPADAERALDRIYYWGSGQPYLSQKLARAVAREQLQGEIETNIDRLAMHQLAGRAAISSEPHMSHLHRAIVNDKKNGEALLTTYGKIRKGIRISYEPDSRCHRRLLALGFVVVDADGNLRIRNRIYESVFTARWANENLPLHWRGPAIAALIVIALTAVPFAYTQLLPKPYLRVMSNAALDMQTISQAYLNLRSFPGHDQAADRMYQTVLENRARQANDRNQIRQISRYAALLPQGEVLGEQMQAAFWDRQAQTAMRNERRDDALLASLEALRVSTQKRRRRAASLVGDDYSILRATVPAQVAEGLVFNAASAQLSYFNGAEVSQWTFAGNGVESHDPWTISALEVSPLLRRVIVDREGTASRIGLTINVSHPRLDDIRMRLIAPSGRTAELLFSQPSSAANEEIHIPRSQLDALLGESLRGTWTLSLRDEETGATGHLISWNLSLNSQVVVESFERGLDIPDPTERPSENHWFSEDGRYAVARALQSDSARVWDLDFARATRTIAVPAGERVAGMSANAEFLVTMSQNTVNLWRTSDGRRARALELGVSLRNTTLSADRQHLLVSYQRDPDTVFEVWSLASGDLLSEISVAGVPALQSIDATATTLAIADFDRAVRVWDLRQGQQIAQFDLAYQPSSISLSANGQTLGIVFGNQGVALWDTDTPGIPLLSELGTAEWQLAFSPSGARFVVGNRHEGLQVYRSMDAKPIGPLIDPGLKAGIDKIFAFSATEDLLVTAGRGDIARFWSIPDVAAGTRREARPAAADEELLSRGSGMIVAAVSPGAERIAFGDRLGHVHIEQVGAVTADPDADAEELSFLGHRDAVQSVVFSPDGALVASAGADRSIRVWDAHSGLPRPYYGRAAVAVVERMAFSPSGKQLAVLGGQQVSLIDTENGAELATVDLGEAHADIAFASDDELFLGGVSGTLRSLYPDRTGNWHMRTVWNGPDAIRYVEIASGRPQIALVDSKNRVRLLDPRDGHVSTEVLELPSSVDDVAFSPDGSRILFRSGRWLHRALMTPAGLIWSDSIRAPKAIPGSAMAFDVGPGKAKRGALSGESVLILARDAGSIELVELHFGFSAGPALFGSKAKLLADWSERLKGSAPIAYVREGF